MRGERPSEECPPSKDRRSGKASATKPAQTLAVGTARPAEASNMDSPPSTSTDANASSRVSSKPSEAAEEPVLNGDGNGEGVHGATTQPGPNTSPPPPTKGTGKRKLKAGKKGKGATGPSCANCGEPGSQRCGGCGMVHYCRKNIVMKNGKKVNMCQQVSCKQRTERARSTLL